MRKRLAEIKGILFDMDGVLIDSERMYYRICKQVITKKGISFSEEMFLQGCGANSQQAALIYDGFLKPGYSFGEMQQEIREPVEKYRMENNLLKKDAADVLHWLKEEKYGIALVTSSDLKTAEANFAASGLWKVFDYVVTGDCVSRSKPAPDIYLKGAAGLHLLPEECLAVEDSYAGLRSAKAAGCLAAYIPDFMELSSEQQAVADIILAELRDIKSCLFM